MYDTPHITLTDDQADEVVEQHLTKYLHTCMDFLDGLRGIPWTDVQRQDFVDNLRSAQALVVVLQDFTVAVDFTETQQTLNEHSDYLNTYY